MGAKGKQVFTRPVTDVRSIQIGLRGSAVEKLLDSAFVLQISDVTPKFRSAASALEVGDVEAATTALWPRQREREFKVPPNLEAVLGMRDEDTPARFYQNSPELQDSSNAESREFESPTPGEQVES